MNNLIGAVVNIYPEKRVENLSETYVRVYIAHEVIGAGAEFGLIRTTMEAELGMLRISAR